MLSKHVVIYTVDCAITFKEFYTLSSAFEFVIGFNKTEDNELLFVVGPNGVVYSSEGITQEKSENIWEWESEDER